MPDIEALAVHAEGEVEVQGHAPPVESVVQRTHLGLHRPLPVPVRQDVRGIDRGEGTAHGYRSRGIHRGPPSSQLVEVRSRLDEAVQLGAAGRAQGGGGGPQRGP